MMSRVECITAATRRLKDSRFYTTGRFASWLPDSPLCLPRMFSVSRCSSHLCLSQPRCMLAGCCRGPHSYGGGQQHSTGRRQGSSSSRRPGSTCQRAAEVELYLYLLLLIYLLDNQRHTQVRVCDTRVCVSTTCACIVSARCQAPRQLPQSKQQQCAVCRVLC